MERMLVGLSLSFCVRDIARGIVPEEAVAYIIAGTRACNEQEFEELLAYYEDLYWGGLPTASAIARRLYAQGKIRQPRCQGKSAPSISRGHWR